MITTEEIAINVYQILNQSEVKAALGDVEIDYERSDYSKDGVIIVPHVIDGEGSVRFGQVKVNIHVPDVPIETSKETSYRTNFPRLMELRGIVIEQLSNHYEHGKGYNWTIGQLDPPIKEPAQNEHFVSLPLEITVRNKKQII